jgi:GNAT superfamily N-acetyltransferase
MTGPAVTIRPREAADVKGILDCVRELQAYERVFEPRMIAPRDIGAAYLDWLDADCRQSAGAILVAEAGGEIAGYVCVLARVECRERDEIEYDHALVADLVVREAWRGRGIGRALLDAAERYATDNGAKWLRISVLHANGRACRVYEDFGFRPRLVEMEKTL